MFQHKCPHRCDTGFRKRNIVWEIVGMYISDYIRLKAMKSVLDADLLPLFSGHTTLLDAKDELDRIIGQLEDRFKKEGKMM